MNNKQKQKGSYDQKQKNKLDCDMAQQLSRRNTCPFKREATVKQNYGHF